MENKIHERIFTGLMVVIGGYVLMAKPLVFSTVSPPQEQISSSIEKTTSTPRVLHGLDASNDQGKVNWGKVAATGIDFIYLKATDGMTYQDPRFADNMSQLITQNVQVGAYHFFEVEDDPTKQAENYLQTIRGKKLSLSPMVDVELTRNVKPEEIQKRLHQFLDLIESATGCTPVLYSYGDFWEVNIGTSFNRYPFWLADYSAQMQPPKGLENIQLWQHSDKGSVSGIHGPVDLDETLHSVSSIQAIQCQVKEAAK